MKVRLGKNLPKETENKVGFTHYAILEKNIEGKDVMSLYNKNFEKESSNSFGIYLDNEKIKEIKHLEEKEKLLIINYSEDLHNKINDLLNSNRVLIINYSGDLKNINTFYDKGAYFAFDKDIIKNEKLQKNIQKIKQKKFMLFFDEEDGLTFLDFVANLRNISREDTIRISSYNTNFFLNLGIKDPNTYVYEIRDRAYINLTNACTNDCLFCPRMKEPVVKGHYLGIDKSPTAEEIIKELPNPEKYKEVVFCGYGEPTLCIDTIIEVAKYLKSKNVKTRMNTNGQILLTKKKSLILELRGLLDVISISLNFHNAELYDKYCRSIFGKKAHYSLLEFAKMSKEQLGAKVVLSVLDGYENVDKLKCKKIADDLGVDFRLRAYYD